MKLPRARFLPRMRWCEELSQMAMRIANYCNNEAITQCANTPHFLQVSRSTSISDFSFKAGIDIVWTATITQWISYIVKADGNFIDSYPENPTKQQTQLANILLQDNTEMGCGVLIKAFPNGTIIYIVCLYNKSPKPGKRIYELYTNKTNE